MGSCPVRRATGERVGATVVPAFHQHLDSAAVAVNILLKFADDTKVAQPQRNDTDRAALQGALNRLTEWADRWGMAFNVQKCKVMHVGRNNPRHEYSMAGTVLSETVEERDLGVVMFRTLKPSAQCSWPPGLEGDIFHGPSCGTLEQCAGRAEKAN